MTARSFNQLIELETKPKHKGFFGKIFDASEFAKKVNIHSTPQYKLFCGVERANDKGVYIPELSRVWEGHSLLANWYNQLRSVTFAVNGNDGTTWDDGYINFKDFSGAVISQEYPIIWLNANGYLQNGTADAAPASIIIGTDNTPVTERDHYLVSRILHGTTVGKASHGVPSGNVAYDSVNKIWQIDISRGFTGNTVSSVSVQELGLILIFYNTKYTMTARDIVSPAETIPISTLVTFHYILQQINPA